MRGMTWALQAISEQPLNCREIYKSLFYTQGEVECLSTSRRRDLFCLF